MEEVFGGECQVCLECGEGKVRSLLNHENIVSDQYDKKYFAYQSAMGEFGGLAENIKFARYIKPNDTVLDFGCGGGYVLRNLNCAKKIGVEPNLAAHEICKKNGVEIFTNSEQVLDNSVDIIISNHCLEHCLRPFDEIKFLRNKLKENGKIIFYVPCESSSCKYKPNDKDQHIYTWAPLNLGNLFAAAGFIVEEVTLFKHKWPPKYKFIVKFLGWNIFHILAKFYARINRSYVQVKLVARKS